MTTATRSSTPTPSTTALANCPASAALVCIFQLPTMNFFRISGFHFAFMSFPSPQFLLELRHGQGFQVVLRIGLRPPASIQEPCAGLHGVSYGYPFCLCMAPAGLVVGHRPPLIFPTLNELRPLVAAIYFAEWYSWRTCSRSTVGTGNLRFKASRCSTTIRAIVRLRNHLWSEGTINHGAGSVLHRERASS